MIAAITDPAAYGAIRQRVNSETLSGAPFPGQVFAKADSRFYFFDFDSYFNPDLIACCSHLSQLSGDSYYHFLLLAPDPVTYYHKHFGSYGLYQIDAQEPAEAVWDHFEADPGGSPADALAYRTDTFVINSCSQKWAVWGSRGHGVIILATVSDLNPSDISAGNCRCHDLESAMASFLRRDSRIHAALRANYKN